MGSNERKHRRSVRQAISLVVVIVAAVLAWPSIQAAMHDGGNIRAHFVKTTGGKTEEFSLEVVSTQAGRSKGLMFRRQGELDERHGMLFIFPEESVHSFWMKNTLLPLDMIFIAENRTVVGVVENATPLSEDARSVPGSSKFVVEVLGGVAKKHGISAGSEVVFDRELPRAE